MENEEAVVEALTELEELFEEHTRVSKTLLTHGTGGDYDADTELLGIEIDELETSTQIDDILEEHGEAIEDYLDTMLNRSNAGKSSLREYKIMSDKISSWEAL